MGQMLFTDDISGSLNLTGSLVLVNGTLIGTSSWASSVPSSGVSGTVVSSSYAVSTSFSEFAKSSDFNNLTNKPTLFSSSIQTNSGSFTGSFTGSLQGTATSANSANLATSASYAITASFAATQPPTNFSDITGKPTLVSSSLQISTGSFTGSFTGSVQGNASTSTSASYALSASYADISRISDFNTLLNKPTLVSNSLQVNSGSFTGSFTGSVQGNASTATTATSATSASYALTASYADNVSVSAADFNTLLNKPTLVSSALQVNSGSFSGSFTGSFQGSITSASYALTASYAANAGGPGGTIDGSGANGQITRWLDSNTIENSSLSDSGSRIATSSSLIIGNAIAAIEAADTPAIFVTQSTQPLAVTILELRHNINNYGQLNVQNDSSGVSASSDIVVTSNMGLETSGFANLGINSAGYTFSKWGGAAGDAYFLSLANKLYISNASGSGPNSKIVFSAGGTNADQTQILIVSSSREVVITGSLTIPSSSLTSSIFTPIEIAHSFLTTQSISNSSAGSLSGSVTASIYLDRGQFVNAVVSRSAIINWEVRNMGGVGFNKADGFILKLVSGGLGTHTWMPNTSWPGGIAPTLTPSGGVDILTFVTSAGVSSSQWYGVLSQRNSK